MEALPLQLPQDLWASGKPASACALEGQRAGVTTPTGRDFRSHLSQVPPRTDEETETPGEKLVVTVRV